MILHLHLLLARNTVKTSASAYLLSISTFEYLLQALLSYICGDHLIVAILYAAVRAVMSLAYLWNLPQ